MPAHWEVQRLGTLLQERGEINGDGHVSEVLSVLRNRGVIPYAEKGNIGNKKSEDITRYKIVRPDDIVVNSMNVIIGSVGLSTHTGCLSPVYYVLTRRSKGDDPQYLNAYFQTKPFQQSLVRIGNGILAHRMRIPMELLNSEPFPRPPLPEQCGIVRYLDYVDRRIRRYVAAKQKLIALFEEEKQAIVNHAVTRGLDPNVPLKPSGVEWLGDVPAHWVVSALKWYSRCHSGNGLPTEEVSSEPVAARRTPVIGGNGLMGFADRGNCQGSVLAIGRVGALCGNVHMVERPTWITDNALMLSLHAESISVKYLATVLKARNLNDIARQTAQPLITGTQVLNERIPVPSLPEQNAIVEYLDNATTNIESVIARARRQIELVQEYRTRLIADVVTGKLDVREAAARLPEEAGWAKSIDEETMRPDNMDGDPFEEGQPTEEEIAIGREVTV